MPNLSLIHIFFDKMHVKSAVELANRLRDSGLS